MKSCNLALINYNTQLLDISVNILCDEHISELLNSKSKKYLCIFVLLLRKVKLNLLVAMHSTAQNLFIIHSS